MNSLKSPEKKWYFNIAVGIFIFLLVCIGFSMQHDKYKALKADYTKEQLKIDSCNKKIKAYELSNRKADSVIHDLEHKNDSLRDIKPIIMMYYDKKMKSINSASAIEHAQWIDTIVAKSQIYNRKK